MKKVKMITLASGPDGVFPPGSEKECSDQEAKDLVDGKYAEYIQEKPPPKKRPAKKKKPAAKVETATDPKAAAAEKAAITPSNK